VKLPSSHMSSAIDRERQCGPKFAHRHTATHSNEARLPSFAVFMAEAIGNKLLQDELYMRHK